jgi:hypothetical protein
MVGGDLSDDHQHVILPLIEQRSARLSLSAVLMMLRLGPGWRCAYSIVLLNHR